MTFAPNAPPLCGFSRAIYDTEQFTARQILDDFTDDVTSASDIYHLTQRERFL